MDGPQLSGKAEYRADSLPHGAGPAVRLSFPGGAVRELDDPRAGDADRQLCRAGGPAGADRLRGIHEHLCPAGPGHAHRPCGQERHPDGGVLQAGARGRQRHRGGGPFGG